MATQVKHDYTVITESMVNVFISSNCNSFTSEKKFAKDLTVAGLKNKLELITGASALSMSIAAFDKSDKKLCDLDEDTALLGSYPVDSGCRLHVEDTNKSKDEFENLANVEKFTMTADEYSKRTDTVQSFMKRNKMGKYNAEEVAKLEAEKAEIEKEEAKAAENMKIGDRCQIRVPEKPTRVGSVQYVGKMDESKPGYWVGVKFDEPLGKNDGSVGGKRYFTCQAKYGGFVKISHVEVGDFPEEDFGLSDDDEM